MTSKPTLWIAGASQNSGLALARIASATHRVTGFSRSPSAPDNFPASATWLALDATQRPQVSELFQTYDPPSVVVCTICGGPVGASADNLGTCNLIDAALRVGVAHFILVTSLGCGDSRPFASERLLQAIGPILEEKSKAEEHLRASGLAHSILRPGWLIDGPLTNRARWIEDPSIHGKITREELANCVYRLSLQPASNKTYSIVDPSLS